MSGTDCSPGKGTNGTSADDDTILPALDLVDEQERDVRVCATPDKVDEQETDEQLRDYQLEVLRKSMKQNVVAYMLTGTGKTLIAVMLVKHYADTYSKLAADVAPATEPKIVVCVVPTTVLVAQQAAVFRRHVNVGVGEYTGRTKVDRWAKQRWSAEARNKRVFVITPSILIEALRKACICMSSVHLLIFDEAHHCRGRHHYAQIMNYYWKVAKPEDRPRIFGMTASPVKSMHKASIVTQLRELESAMDAKVLTVSDLTSVQAWVPEPAKEHLQYVELESLKEDSMMHRTLQVLWSSALRLSCVRKQLLLLSEGEDLKIEQQTKPDPRAIYVRGDYKALIRAHPERIGEWLGRTLTHCLFHQGPYCAALLLKAQLMSAETGKIFRALSRQRAGSSTMPVDDDAVDEHPAPTTGEGATGEGTVEGAGPGQGPTETVKTRLQKWEEESELLEKLLRSNGIPLDSVDDPLRCICECIYDTIHLLILMLVCDKVMAQTLIAAARKISQPKDTHVVNPAALADILEAAISTVPPALLERALLRGCTGYEADAWQQRMQSDLFTPKVCTLFQELFRQKAQATEALEQAGASSTAHHLLNKATVKKILSDHNKDNSPQHDRWACLVFVLRQACSFVLNELMLRLPSFSTFIHSGDGKFLPRLQQDKSMALFRTGHCNLLFTTNVAEEGLDIQNCSLVICYNVPKTPLSLVQTVGRARARNARVLFMEEVKSDGAAKSDRVQEMEKYTESLRELVLLREALTSEEPTASPESRAQESHLDSLELAGLDKEIYCTGSSRADLCYTVASTQASATPTQALSLLHRYCTSLMCKRALINSGWNKEVAQSAAAAASNTAEAEWVQRLLGAGASVVRSRRHGDCSSELRALRPHFVTDSMLDSIRQCTVYQSTVFLPRVCPIRQVEGPFARTAKRAQELVAMVAIKELHELKEVDNFLKPSSDSAIKKIMSASSQEDVVRWLDERVAGDRIDESSWAEMQTWRKPPDMKLQRNIPVALDYRSASSPSAGSHGRDPLPHDPTGLHSRQSDTTMCDPMPTDGANHVEGDCSIGKKKYWLYSFQVAYERDQGNPTEGAASQDLKRLSLGILLLTPLPDVPGFEIHLDKDMPSNCCLLPGGTVELSDEELMKLQSYHTELLKVLFSAEDDGRTAPTEVAIAVTETRVRVTISVRRVVQSVPASQLHEPTEIVAASDAQGQVLSSERAADGPAQAHTPGKKEHPVPVTPKKWCQSSSGAWFTIIPVTHSPAQAPASGSKGVGCGAAPMDTHDAPLSKEPTLLRSGDVLMSTDGTAPPVRGESQEMCDAQDKASAAGAIMGIDWSTVRDMCDQGLVPLPELVGQQFWRLEHVSDSSETAQLNAHEVQKNVSEQLVDRIIVSNHGDSQLQYLFYGFMPRSNIDMPWPYNKSKQEVQQERKAAKKRAKEAAKIASEMLSHKKQKTMHTVAEDPTMMWEKSGLYRARQKLPGGRTGAQPTNTAAAATAATEDTQMSDEKQGDDVVARSACAGAPCLTRPEHTAAMESAGARCPMPSEQQSGAACSVHMDAGSKKDSPKSLKMHDQMHAADSELRTDDLLLHVACEGCSEVGAVHVNIACIAESCKVQLRPVCNPLKRKAAPGDQTRDQQSSQDDPVATYVSFQDFYERKYGVQNLSKKLPLMNVRRLPLHVSAPNYLVPPTQGSRRRELLRTAQHEAIEKSLSDVSKQPHAEPPPTASDPNAPEQGAPAGPKLVPEICSIHPLRVSTLQALQFLPSLMYRLEGLLVAHELKEKLCPQWLAASDAPSSNKVLEAITHRSCADSIDYERYEFFGDSFLKFATANHLYSTCKDANEGMLSTETHRRVSNGTLWRAAVTTKWLGVDMEKPLPDGWEWKMRGVADCLRMLPFRLNYWTPPGLIEQAHAPRNRVQGKVVSDAMEAIIEWSRDRGGQSLVSMVQQQIKESKKQQQQPSGLCSIQCDGAEPAETFLPSQAFEMDVAEHPGSVLTPQGTRTLAGDFHAVQVLHDMRQALLGVPIPPVPCPTLDRTFSEVCKVIQSSVGCDRLQEVVPLENISTSLLPQSQPLAGTKLAARVEKYLYREGLQLMQQHLGLALTAAGTDRQLRQRSEKRQLKGDNVHVKLSKALQHTFKDPQLERTARIHSCVLLSSIDTSHAYPE